MSKNYAVPVEKPHSITYVARSIPEATVEQRERALAATHYNEFAFPAGMLTVDMLSDSGTTAMTDMQWSALFLGDESYGAIKAITFCWTRCGTSLNGAIAKNERLT